MIPLPDCRYREAVSIPQRWRCTCSHLAIPRTLVTSGDCQVCPVTNGLVTGEAPQHIPTALASCDPAGFPSNGNHQSTASQFHTDRISEVSSEIAANWPRHLIYHLYPFRNSVWRENIDELRQRIALFNGQRIISVVLDDKSETREVAAAELANLNADVRWYENDRRLGESISLLPALKDISALPGITFYAHAKGVTHHDTSVVFGIWTRKMYELLDRFDQVSERLLRCGFCGLIRATGQPIAEGKHQWHYPGSFYWFRNDVVAHRMLSIDCRNRFFPEQLPSQIVRFTESSALYSPLLYSSPYHRETWEQLAASVDSPQTIELFDPVKSAMGGFTVGNSPRTVLSGNTFPLIDPPSTAIVIAGRNNSRYLAEAIESALAQTIPCEVVYADDCSTDDSIQLASDYITRGLRILPSGVHKGVCDARNRGARSTLADNIVFLDADDCLPENYAAKCLEVMTPNTPFVYSAARAFGNLINHVWQALPWNSYDLWQHNQIHTSAMWARWAFMAAGEWQDDIPTMWDYDLAIRCSRFGMPTRSKVAIGYRTHSGSISVALNERDGTACIPFKEIIRRKNARLGIGCLISGRLPKLFPKWMDAIACSVRWAMRYGVLKNKPRLQLCIHGRALQQFHEIQVAASQYLDTLESVEIREFKHEVPMAPEQERLNESATLLAKASASMQSQSGADIFWFVEDDIIVPIRSCAWLFQELTAGANPPHGISGVYRNRHAADRCIGGWYRAGRYEEPLNFEAGKIQSVDFTGSGCLMYWTSRPETPRQWRTHASNGQAAHDFCWSDDLRYAGGRLLMHGGIRCAHARTEDDLLEC